MSEWEQYHEPLNRIFREVRKALPYWESVASDREIYAREMAMYDSEVVCEIENLLRKMIEDIENER